MDVSIHHAGFPYLRIKLQSNLSTLLAKDVMQQKSLAMLNMFTSSRVWFVCGICSAVCLCLCESAQLLLSPTLLLNFFIV